MHLVMLETNGNQRYIFSSPRQRENIGGSYLLTMLAPWTLVLAERVGINAEPVSVSSGKIILTVPDEDSARTLIGEVTRRVLALAPGMDITGVFAELSTPSEAASPNQTATATITESDLSGIHVVANRYNLSRPPAEARFPQTPFLQRGHDSVLPASPTRTILWTRPPGDTHYSLASQVKRACARRARRQLVAQAKRDETMRAALDGEAIRILADSLHSLEVAFDADRETQEGAEPSASSDSAPAAPENEEDTDPEDADNDGQELHASELPTLSKIAVIHIDGNGVGAIMRNLQKSAGLVPDDVFKDTIGCTKDDPDYLRRFLLAVNSRLDHAVRHAFLTAWAEVAQLWRTEHQASRRVIPVVPILLGGDDLTVLTESRCALPFMETYLRTYEEATSQDPVLRYLGPHTGKTGPMTAAAGAAIVPRPFPFHLAYSLAEELVSAAKAVGKRKGQECSTLTYHALFDSTIVDASVLIKGYESFTARPYRLNEVPPSPESAPPADDARPAPDRQAPNQESQDDKNDPPPLHGATWADMLERTRHFRGLPADDVPAFPRTRATRIRKHLSDSAQAAARGGEDGRRGLEKTIAVEWQDARRVLGDRLIEAIGDPHYVFDLLELADLLPASYLNRAASEPVTSTQTTSQEDQ